MTLHGAGARGLVAVTAALVAIGCKGLCMGGSPPDRCEGDVLLRCTGGWLGDFSIRPKRFDCRAQGKRCLTPQEGTSNWARCEAPVGPCDPATFVPRCSSEEPSDTGFMTACVNGEELRVGAWCVFDNPGSSSAAAPSSSGP